MKKITLLFAVILFVTSIFAQAPQKMSYQCVVRNSNGELLTNQGVGIRIAILQGSAAGSEVYKETYNPNPQTNENGLLSIEIGTGLVISGSFASIDWAAGPYYLKTETDPSGGTIYTITATSQLLSVPYAFYAQKAANGFSGNYNDLSNLPSLNITNWNTAFSWGNHAGLYRPVSWVPSWTDVTGKPSFAIVATSGSYNDLLNLPSLNISNWNTAFGWGNHAGLYRLSTWVPSWSDVTGKPIVFPPSPHAHSAVDISSGTLPANFGGTGISTYSAGNYIYASGTTILAQRTPLQVRDDIQAAASIHTHPAIDITGILPVTSGGTGASTAASARTNLGATTVGSHLFTLPNPLAVRFIRIDADNRISLRDAVGLRKDIEAGTVNSIATTNGITGGPVTSSGTIGLEGQALALHNLSTYGFMVRTGSGTFATRYLNDGNGIVITNPDGVSGNPTISAKTYDIGDWAFGGIVVWVDATGQHGFVCAKSDQDGGTGVRWNAGTNTWTMAMGDGPLAGKSNTSIIIASQSYGDAMTYAARLCNELQQTQNSKSYGDWYLPSEEELFLMYQNRTTINNTAALYAGSTPLAATLYWSSKEYNNSLARYVNFSNGNVGSATKGQLYRVRAVRAF